MTTAIKERGIRMHAREVTSILAKRQTQARRIVKGAPDISLICGPYSPTKVDRCGEQYPGDAVFGAYDEDGLWARKCPYGQPGDRLWVRETWQALWFQEAYSEGFGLGYADDYGEASLDACRAYLAAKDRETWRKCEPFGVVYRADSDWDEHKDDRGFNWRPSLHMPRWASRITLEITDVRVERVQDITIADVLAEGVVLPTHVYKVSNPETALARHCPEYVGPWAALWDDTNGKGAWDRNDWCWALTFKRVD